MNKKLLNNDNRRKRFFYDIFKNPFYYIISIFFFFWTAYSTETNSIAYFFRYNPQFAVGFLLGSFIWGYMAFVVIKAIYWAFRYG